MKKELEVRVELPVIGEPFTTEEKEKLAELRTNAETDELLDQKADKNAVPFEKGEGNNTAVQKGSLGMAFGDSSVIEGTSSTSAIDRGIDSESTNEEIINEWKNSSPESEKFTVVKGKAAHAEGNNGLALGDHSHVEGNGCIASNNSSHAEGTGSVANGKYAHAEGLETQASGDRAHAEGCETEASTFEAHAEGNTSRANARASHAEGYNSETSKSGYSSNTLTAKSQPSESSANWYNAASHAEGNATIAQGLGAHAEGEKTFANERATHAEGKDTVVNSEYSHAEGLASVAGTGHDTGTAAHAEGESTEAAAWASHAEGYSSKANAWVAHAEGAQTVAGTANSQPSAYNDDADGRFAHAEGNGTWAKGSASHAEGRHTRALKKYDHAEGWDTKADGIAAHAEGEDTEALAECSHAEGWGTKTLNDCEHAEGQWNESHKEVGYYTIHSIGIGSSSSDRKNALEVMKNGEVYLQQVGGYTDGDSIRGADSLQHVLSTFITKSVNNLENYYTKKGTYSKSEVDSLIGAIESFHYEIAQSTSSVVNPQSNMLYLIGPTGTGSDKYEEYVYPNAQTGWVKIGDTSINLSGYALRSEVPFEQGTGSNSAILKGGGNAAPGESATSEGSHTSAPGKNSHAEGSYSVSGGEGSHAEGGNTRTSNKFEHAEGSYNKSHTGTDAESTIHSTGIGSSTLGRINAFEIMRNGDTYIYGVGGYEGDNLKNEASKPSKTLQEVIAGKQDTIGDLGAIRSGSAAGATAYQLPEGGIPYEDMSSDVQEDLDMSLKLYEQETTSEERAAAIANLGLTVKPGAGTDSFVQTGSSNTATGTRSGSVGANNTNAADNAFATGYQNTISSGAVNSFASGRGNTVNSINVAVGGRGNTLSGEQSAAFGRNNTVTGKYGQAFGFTNTVSADAGVAVGTNMEAAALGALAAGKFGTVDDGAIMTLGVGASANARKNALAVSASDGKVYVDGLGGFDGSSTIAAQPSAKSIQDISPLVVHITLVDGVWQLDVAKGKIGAKLLNGGMVVCRDNTHLRETTMVSYYQGFGVYFIFFDSLGNMEVIHI